jgi:uncharacterized RDD family membrane protein YckC
VTQRLLTQSALEVSPVLIAHPLASPFRRLSAFLFDWILLSIPTVVVSIVVAAISLSLTDPDALSGIRTLVTGEQDENTTLMALADIAPLLVRIDAPGLPATVKVAVEESDFRKAGELLIQHDLDFSLAIGSDPPPLPPGHIRVDIQRLIPNTIRGIAVFGTAAIYFTLLTAASCTGTFGKRLFRIHVVRLDDRPLSKWESFERFGGYLASVGTFGAGFFDIWRDPNRRLAHDRISNTVVLKRIA